MNSFLFPYLRRYSIRIASNYTKNYEMTHTSEFINIKSEIGARIITLNRPQAMNALDLSMIRTISDWLQLWEQSP